MGNSLDDVEELFRVTQEIIDKNKKVKFRKKRRSYAIRMSNTKKPQQNNASNENPFSKEEGKPKIIDFFRLENPKIIQY